MRERNLDFPKIPNFFPPPKKCIRERNLDFNFINYFIVFFIYFIKEIYVMYV